MPIMKTTRRAMLAALAASTAAAAANASPGAAENPELVKLADQIEPTLSAYLDAEKQVKSIMAEWQPKAPEPPMVERPDGYNDTIVRFGEGARTYSDIAGKPIPIQRTPDWRQVVEFGTAEEFAASAASHRAEAKRRSRFKTQRGMKGELRWAENEEAKIEPARQYWTEFDRVVAQSGIDTAKAELEAKRTALHDLVGRIMHFEETTTEGLIIKAQALAAWHKVDRFYVTLDPDAFAWAGAFNATVLRQVAA